MPLMKKEVTHRGYCHCRAVRFEFQGPEDIVAWKCNCSICVMKGNVHTIVPKSKFTLTSGEEHLTTYTFNTHQAKHLFCRICGVQSFYIPRSNPDGYGVTIYCIDQSTVKSTAIKEFDGENWEASFGASGISSLSKVPDS